MQVRTKATTGLSLLLSFSLAVLMQSCKPDELGPEQWVKWAENPDNGLKKQAESGDARYSVFLKPIEYIKAKSILLGDTGKFFKANNSSVIEFNIRMEPINGKTNFLAIGTENQEEALAKVSYYNGEMESDIRLICEKDTLYPSNYIYERYYNLSPSQTCIVGFDISSKISDGMTFQFEDRALNTGLIQFEFDRSILSKLPKLTQ